MRLAIVAFACVFLFGSGITPALGAEDGSYVMQCICPLEWGGDWDGNGVFNEDDSLDTVALANDGAVLLFHEIPLEEGSIEGMVEDRSASLEDAVDGSVTTTNKLARCLRMRAQSLRCGTSTSAHGRHSCVGSA